MEVAVGVAFASESLHHNRIWQQNYIHSLSYSIHDGLGNANAPLEALETT
jgi:hypothetical protein